MEYIVTYNSECFSPLEATTDNIKIEDIAHSLSLLCRASGHLDRFFSVAQHSINCANEAKARGYTARVQLACLVHDGSEAYLSDITRPVKLYMPEYRQIEERLQNVIYQAFLGDPLTDDEFKIVDEIDGQMLVCEFDALSHNKHLRPVYINAKPFPQMKSEPSFETRGFAEVETEFLKTYYGIMHAGLVQGR